MQSDVSDPEQIARLLELELTMKRAQWKQAKAKRRGVRSATFAFLFILVAGGIMAFLFLWSRAQQERTTSGPVPAEAAAPATNH